MEIKCPVCESTKVQTLSMVYQSGTRFSQSRSRGNAVSFDRGGVRAIVGGSGSAGYSQSLLAINHAPPEKSNFIIPLFTTFCLGSLVRLINLDSEFGMFMITSFLVSLALTIYVGNHNFVVWPKAYEQWSKAWHCHKCGTDFIPNENNETENSQEESNIS